MSFILFLLKEVEPRLVSASYLQNLGFNPSGEQYWTFELLDVETAERTEYVRKIVAHHGAMGESSCNNVRSAISTSHLILLIMSLSCSEKISDFPSAFDRIPSASLSWSTNHLMSFDTFFIILFFWFYFAKIQKNPNNRIPFHLSYIFRALINILPLPATFSKLFPDFLACFEILLYFWRRI